MKPQGERRPTRPSSMLCILARGLRALSSSDLPHDSSNTVRNESEDWQRRENTQQQRPTGRGGEVAHSMNWYESTVLSEVTKPEKMNSFELGRSPVRAWATPHSRMSAQESEHSDSN